MMISARRLVPHDGAPDENTGRAWSDAELRDRATWATQYGPGCLAKTKVFALLEFLKLNQNFQKYALGLVCAHRKTLIRGCRNPAGFDRYRKDHNSHPDGLHSRP
jgi:hypothetical protein